MPVEADSYMGIFLPRDIQRRIMQFMARKIGFPFVEQHELMASFHLFGKKYGLNEQEKSHAADLAKRTAQMIAADVRHYGATPDKLDAEVTRQNYTKRSLQIVVDSGADMAEMNSRVSGDPAILADCFAQHVAYYRQDFFFELFGPLKGEQLPKHLGNLSGRMVLLGYNRKDRRSIPFSSPLDPFFDFASD